MTFFNGEGSASGDTVDIALTGGGTFTFDSVDTSTFRDTNNDQVMLTKFLGGTSVGSLLLDTSTSSPNAIMTVGSSFSSRINLVEERVVFGSTDGSDNAPLLDNFRFNSVVSEPSSLVLLGCGVANLLGTKRCRRRTA